MLKTWYYQILLFTHYFLTVTFNWDHYLYIVVLSVYDEDLTIGDGAPDIHYICIMIVGLYGEAWTVGRGGSIQVI